jgi:hypothetical protein
MNMPVGLSFRVARAFGGDELDELDFANRAWVVSAEAVLDIRADAGFDPDRTSVQALCGHSVSQERNQCTR